MSLNRDPYLYDPSWRPRLSPGDIVVLMIPGGPRCHRVDFVEALPKLQNYDLARGSGVANGASTSPSTIQNSSAQDVLAVGPDEWVQSRVALDELDWLDTNGTTQPAQLTIWQPGAGQGRLLTLYKQAFWDVRAQNRWTSLAPTEMWQWYNQTSQYEATNNTGVTMSYARINAYGWHYAGEFLASFDPQTAQPSDKDGVTGKTAGEIMQMAARSPYGMPMYLPCGAQFFPRAVNQGVS